MNRNRLTSSLVLVGLILVCSLAGNSATLAQANPAYMREVRTFDPNFTMLNAAGLAFSPQANSFLLLAAHSTVQAAGEPANLLNDTVAQYQVNPAFYIAYGSLPGVTA